MIKSHLDIAHLLKGFQQLRTVGLFTLLSFMASLLGYLFNLIVARKFSLAIYGEYSATIAIFLFFTVFFNTINTIVVKKIASQTTKNQVIVAKQLEIAFWQLIKNNMLLAVLASLVVLVLLIVVNKLIVLSAVSLLLFVVSMLVFNFYLSLLIGLRQFFWHGLFNIAWSLWKIILLFVAILLLKDLLGIYASLIMASLIMAIFAKVAVFAKKNLPQQIKLEQKKLVALPEINLTKLLTDPAFFQPLLINLALTGLLIIDVLMAKRLFLADDLGLYSSLSLFARLIFYFLLPITQIAYADFSKENIDLAKKSLLKYVWIISLVAISAIVVYASLPNLAIKIIVGDKFLSLAPILFLSALFAFSYCLLQLQTFYFLAKNKQPAISLVLFLLMSILLMQFFHQSFANLMIINIVISLLANIYLFINLLKTTKQQAKLI